MKNTFNKFSLSLVMLIITLSVTGILKAQKWDFAKRFGSDGDVTPVDLVTDDMGNTYVFGEYNGFLIIDVQDSLKYTDMYGGSDLFVCKFDASGTVVWVKRIASSDKDFAGGITIDDNNNLYLVGSFRGDSLIGWDGKTITNYESGNYDAFLAKFNGNGDIAFIKRIAYGMDNQRLLDIAFDFTNNYLVTVGNFRVELRYGDGIDSAFAISMRDYFIARFDLAGNYIDQKLFYGDFVQSAMKNVDNCIISDVVTGYYVTGDLMGSLYDANYTELLAPKDTFNMDFMVLSFDDNLNFNWGRTGGGWSSDDYANSCGSDRYGNIYFTGKVDSVPVMVDSTATILSAPKTGYGLADYFVAKYNSSGILQWFRREGNIGFDNSKGISVLGQQILYTYDIDSGNINTGFNVCDLDGNILFGDLITGPGEESSLNATFNQSGSGALIIGTFNGDTLKAGTHELQNYIFGFTDGFIARYKFKFKLYLAGKTDILCNNGETGSIMLGTENEASPVTYVWTPDVSTTNTATGVGAGTYKIVATDNEGSKDSVEVTLTEPPAISVSEVSIAGISCNTTVTSGNINDGAVDISVSGGVTAYTYSWSPGGQTTQDLTGVGKGDHTVTVTDANSCEKIVVFNVPEPTAISHVGSTIDTIFVPPGSNGAVYLNTEGGTEPYSFYWIGPSGFPGSSKDTITELEFPGDYIITATDNNSCAFESVINVPSDTLLVIGICDTTHVSCKGGSDGAAEVCVIIGWSGNYLYEWKNSLDEPIGTNNPIISGLVAGTYIVRVTDIVGSVWTEASVTIEEPALIHSVDFDPVYVGCFGGSDGSITTTVTGDGEFTYLWETGQETKDIAELAAGWYKVKVTHSAGCFIYDSVEILQPTILIADITDSTNISIFGTSDGSATVTPSGGTPPYSYVWENGLASTDSTVTGLYAEIWYYVTVTDAHTCTTRDSVILSEPGVLHAEITNSTNASCNGLSDGSATVSRGGGSPPYSIAWNDDAESNTLTITDLSPNRWYTVTVTDAKFQTVKDSVLISEPESLKISKTYSEFICGESSDGYIQLSVSGGTSPYSYKWSNSETTEEIINLPVGEYSVIITDNNSCIAYDTTSIDILKSYQGSEICLVTVNNDNRILVVWEKEYNQGIAYYNIYREQSSKDNYVKIATKPFNDLSVFVDESSVPEENPYFYKISATDSCGNESMLSPLHKSIHLIANLGLNNEINLNWDEYVGFDYYEYEIYRGKSLTQLFSIRTISASIRSWSDKSAPSGQNFYRILVVKPSSCIPTDNKKSIEYGSPFSNYDEETLEFISDQSIKGLNIFPNPIRDQAIVTFNNPLHQSYTMCITDLSGKRFRIVSDITSSEFTIEKGNLSEGVYFIELIGPEIYRGKILIE